MDERELLAAIIASPADDQPRLEYAKWCDIHDSPRGEFVRAQIEMEKLSLNDPVRGKLGIRSRELLKLHEEKWLADIKPLTFFTHFQRGFPEIAGVKVEKFASVAEKLFSLTPIYSLSLCCLDIKDYLPGIISRPELTNISKLSITKLQLDDDMAELIAQSSYLQNLHTLEIGDNKIKSPGIGSLAQSPYLKNLTTLSLYSNKFAAAGAKKLATTTQLHRLKELNLTNCSIGSNGAAALAGSEALFTLKRLLIGRFRFGNTDGGEAMGDSGVAALAKSKYLNSLEILYLSDSAIGDAGAIAIADSSNLSSLVELRLDHNHIGDKGVIALAGATQLSNLKSLDLSENILGKDGLKALAQSPLLKHLKKINLSGIYLPSDRYCEYTDWDGSVTGGGFEGLSLQEIHAAFQFPEDVKLG